MNSSLHVGTVGFRHPQWVGSFYPRGLSSEGFLDHYASHLDAVEVPLDNIADLKALVAFGSRSLRVLITLPDTWISLPPGPLPFHPGLDLLEELAVAGQLSGIRLPLNPRLPPTRDHAVRLRRLAKVFADQGLVVDLPGGRWQDPAVLEWLERIAVSTTWTASPALLQPQVVTGPSGVVRIVIPGNTDRLGPAQLRKLLPGIRSVARGRSEVLLLVEGSGRHGAGVLDALDLRKLIRSQPSPDLESAVQHMEAL